ncbi:3-hydroxyacyl-ACP dehydratase FabZ family protein [Kitasatospora sp. NPDC048239]|uniref:3-hydroxyacyl-ACP dehydratase FabZ family protein n=1 Tax=Kitasatospora sp. NPDC048239 TaxID=3364046 RepID=UPI003710CF79
MNGIARITALIPHRRPALLVDRVVEVEPGKRLVTHKAVTLAEPGYRAVPDQAPDHAYAYPLDLLLESWAQSAVLLACWEQPNADVRAGRVVLLAGVRGARVLAPVQPGCVLVHEVHLVRDVGDAVITTGTTTVEGRTVLEIGQLTLALRGAELLTGAGAPAPTTEERS